MKIPGFLKNLNPFAGAQKAAQPVYDEMATRQRVLFQNYMLWLPNPDPVLKRMGCDITVYKEIQADAYVRGCAKGRKSAVLGLERGLERGTAKSREAKIIEDLLKDLPLQRIIAEMLEATQFGYAPMEVMWGKVGNWILPVDVKGKPQFWFLFDAQDQLRLRLLSDPMGEVCPDRKFLLPRQEATYENPYGFPDLSACFWPATFKKGGMKFWVEFCEKYGQPFMIGKLPRNASDQEKKKLLDALDSMVQDAIGTIPDDNSVEIKESAGKAASSALFRDLRQACKEEISVVQLGHEGGALSTSGKLGNEIMADTVRRDIVDADKAIVETEMNKLIEWIWDYNFSGDRPTWSMWHKEEIDQTLAMRDKNLVSQGVRFKQEYYVSAYGLNTDQFTVGAPQGNGNGGEISPTQAGQFAEGARGQVKTGQHEIDDALGNLTPEELQAQADGMLKPVIDLVNKEKDLNAVMKKLAQVYPEMNSDALQQMLERAVFVSECLGKSEKQ
jgi:phage gp29-like protein